MSSWFGSVLLSLGAQASQNVQMFREKKEAYLQECFKKLLSLATLEILESSLLGNLNTTFTMTEDFPPLKLTTKEGKELVYKITSRDYGDLMHRLYTHFNDKSLFPDLKCERLSSKVTYFGGGIQHGLCLSWKDPEQEEEA